jgi:hypothetical protein
LVSIAGFLLLGLCAFAGAQNAAKHETHEAMSPASPQAGATLSARLVDPEKKAKQKTATVEVTVGGVQMIDPAKTGEKPLKGQAHLHYRVDGGPVIATTATKLSFHELTPGVHKIMIMLAGNDHSPLGPQETLTVTVP